MEPNFSPFYAVSSNQDLSLHQNESSSLENLNSSTKDFTSPQPISSSSLSSTTSSTSLSSSSPPTPSSQPIPFFSAIFSAPLTSTIPSTSNQQRVSSYPLGVTPIQSVESVKSSHDASTTVNNPTSLNNTFLPNSFSSLEKIPPNPLSSRSVSSTPLKTISPSPVYIKDFVPPHLRCTFSFRNISEKIITFPIDIQKNIANIIEIFTDNSNSHLSSKTIIANFLVDGYTENFVDFISKYPVSDIFCPFVEKMYYMQNPVARKLKLSYLLYFTKSDFNEIKRVFDFSGGFNSLTFSKKAKKIIDYARRIPYLGNDFQTSR